MDSAHSLPLLREGISLILSKWSALQTSIENGWGGKESRQKCEDLTYILLSYFSQHKAPQHIEDLESILDENMVLSFNTEIEDGSIEQVAEQMMVIYEDLLHGNYESIEKLRKSNGNSVTWS